MSGELLLVEDRCRTREKIGAELRALGYGVTTARDGSEALAILRTQRVDVVLSDYRMSPMDGLSLLRSVRRTLDLPFILYSSGADAEAVFQAGRDGAFYFLEYPFRIEEQLLPTIEESLSQQQEPAPEDRLGADRIVGCSLEAHRVRSLVRRVACSRATVLVTGETGTGKEVVARAIHDESERGPFVAVAVTELAESLLDSELFGHERGAFTGATQRRRGLFAAATGGTLFLDEIGDAPLGLQSKFLRVLETGDVRPVGGDRLRPVDVRVIAATHRNLAEMVQKGLFRQDLFYRIYQTTIKLAPLRERPSDIEPIARYLLGELAHQARLPIPRLSEEFVEALRAHPWTGNVRELRSVLQNLILWLDGSSELGLGDLLESLAVLQPGLAAEEQVICQQMIECYRRLGWNQEAARRELGLSRGEWRHRWQRFGLDALKRRRR